MGDFITGKLKTIYFVKIGPKVIGSAVIRGNDYEKNNILYLISI